MSNKQSLCYPAAWNIVFRERSRRPWKQSTNDCYGWFYWWSVLICHCQTERRRRYGVVITSCWIYRSILHSAATFLIVKRYRKLFLSFGPVFFFPYRSIEICNGRFGVSPLPQDGRYQALRNRIDDGRIDDGLSRERDRNNFTFKWDTRQGITGLIWQNIRV